MEVGTRGVEGARRWREYRRAHVEGIGCGEELMGGIDGEIRV